MRTNKKILAAVMTFVLTLLVSVFCMNVFAETDDDEMPMTISARNTVSGCDLKKEDLKLARVGNVGFSMLVPEGKFKTPDTDVSYFSEGDYYGRTPFNQGTFFVSTTKGANYCSVQASVSEISPLEKCYGNYSRLTESQQKLLISQVLGDGIDGYSASFQKINGRTYMMISGSGNDESTGENYVVYGLYTIIGDYKYLVQLEAVNPNKNDLNVINEMLNSIKVTGMGQPISVLEIVLIVCVVLLAVGIALSLFFIYRLHRYVSSGIAYKSVIGFDMPEVARPDDEDFDDDYEDFDGFDDDEVIEPSQETVQAISSERIIDE